MGKIMYRGESYSSGGGGSASGTPIPTADAVAEFDSAAHMNSTDMTEQEVSNFVYSINAQGDGAVLKKTPYFTLDTTATSGSDKEIYDALVALGWASDVMV